MSGIRNFEKLLTKRLLFGIIEVDQLDILLIRGIFMKKKLMVVLSLLLVMSLLFTACAPQSKPAEEEKSTEEVVEKTDEKEEEEKPAEEERQEEAEKDAEEQRETEADATSFEGRTLNVVATSEAYVPLFEKFTEKTGAKVEFLSMSSGEVLSRVKAEGGKPMADLWFGGGLDAFIQAKDDGLLEAHMSPNAEDVDAKFKDAEGYWYAKGITVVGLLVNNDVLEENGLEAPTGWKDLADPKYKDEVIMSSPAISGTNYAALKGWLDLWGEEEGWDFFTALNENIPAYGKRGKDPFEKTIAGEFAIGIIPADKSAHDAMEEENVTLIFPEEGIPWVPEGVAIFKGSDNVDIASAFIDFMYEAESQKMIAEIDGKDTNQLVKPGAEGFDLGLDATKLIDEDLSTFGSEREAILEKFQSIAGDKE